MRYDLSRPKTAYRLRKSVLTANDITDLSLPDIWTNCLHRTPLRLYKTVACRSPSFGSLCDRPRFGDKGSSPQGDIETIMPQILNFSEHANDEEVSYLTTLLLYHLVERCGGQIRFTVNDVNQVRENLSTKMVQIQLGDDVKLRIIDRVPELQ